MKNQEQKRQEQKFFLNPEEKANFLKKNKAYIHHPPRKINSIYYDDNDFSFFRDSEEGIVPRKKYRIRWYGVKKNDIKNCFFEIKTTLENYKIKEVEKLPNLNSVEKFFVNKFNEPLYPRCVVSYDRLYYINNDKVRFTYDYNIKYWKFNSNIIYASKDLIFEIKYTGFDSGKFTPMLGDSNTRFSKYTEAVKLLYNF